MTSIKRNTVISARGDHWNRVPDDRLHRYLEGALMDGRSQLRNGARGTASLGLLVLFTVLAALVLEGCSAPERRPRRRSVRERSVRDATRDLERSTSNETLEFREESRGRKKAREETIELADTRDEPEERSLRSGNSSAENALRAMRGNEAFKRDEAARMVDEAEKDRLNLEPRAAARKIEVALQLDPDNSDAQRLQDQIRTELGDSRGEVRTAIRDIREQHQVHMQQTLAEIQILVNDGIRLDEARDFDSAIEKFERAVEIIRSSSLNLNLDEHLRVAQSHLDMSRKNKVRQDRRDRQKFEKRIRNLKNVESKETLQVIQNRVNELRQKARQAFDRQNFDLAENTYRLILDKVPDDSESLTMIRRSLEEQHTQRRMRIFEDTQENHQLAMLSLSESWIVYQKIFRFPDRKEWEKLTPRERSFEELFAERESNAEKEIKARLEEPFEIFISEETPFKEAISMLRDLSGVNIILNRDAKEAVESEAPQVKLARVRDLPLQNILRLILAQVPDASFDFTIQNGAVVVGPRSSLRKASYLHFYDIVDITQARPDFPAPKLALDELEGQGGDEGGFGDIGDDDEETGGRVGLDKLQELIEKEIADPESGDIPEGTSVKIQRGKLAVRTSYDNHLKIQGLLSEFRKATGVMVTVESRFLALQENYLEEIGVNFGNVNNTFLPSAVPDADGTGQSVQPGYEFINAQQDVNVRAATISELSNPIGSRVNPFNLTASGGLAFQYNDLTDQYQLEAILTSVAKEQSTRELSAPRVTAFNTQIAHTLVINQAAFIKDLEVNQTGVIPVINPVIGVLNTGSILEVRPNVSWDRKYIVLEIQPTLAQRLDSEFAILNLSGNFTVVPVELPVTSVTKIKTTVTIPDGGTVLVGGLKKEIENKASLGIPGLRHIPVLNLLFGRKGDALLRSSLFVLINAKVTIVKEEEGRLFNT